MPWKWPAYLGGMLGALAAGCGDVESPIELEASYRCVTCTPQATAISFAVALTNTGEAPIPLGELELRYWIVMAVPGNLVFTCDAADGPFGGCANLGFDAPVITPALPETSVDRVFELTFGPAAGQLVPGAQSPELRVTIARMSGNMLEQGNDYSFDRGKTALATWNRIGVYRGDSLLWGDPPR